MALPALELLARHKRTLTLVGRAWAADLFAAYSWQVLALHGPRAEHVRILRATHAQTQASGVLFTNSFSTALEFRLAGIAAAGYARNGRSFLLDQALTVQPDDHMVEYYHRLAAAVVGVNESVRTDLMLRITDAARRTARTLLDSAGVGGRYIVLCPVAIGTHHGKVKAWSGFTRLSRDLIGRGERVVAMPGPNETAAVRAALPGAVVLPESDVGTFAALLAAARVVVGNDSGSAHVAAAVGVPLITVIGVTEPDKTRPWSSKAKLVGSSAGWPGYDEVLAAVDDALSI